MESQALGTPLVPDRTVKSVVDAITACQGAFIVGHADATFADDAAASIIKMLTDVSISPSPRGGTHIHQTLANTMEKQNIALKNENSALIGKVDVLVGERKTALASLRNREFASVEAVIAHIEALLR